MSEALFTAWLAEVNAEVERITGFDRDSFTDWHYADAFEDGVDAVDAARLALANDDIGREFLALAGIGVDDEVPA